MCNSSLQDSYQLAGCAGGYNATAVLLLLAGAKLITLHRDDKCFLAVSTHNTDGIVAVQAANGVLLASFNKPTLPTIALTAMQEACVAAFKRKRSPADEEDR
jgi:hypothetical protein